MKDQPHQIVKGLIAAFCIKTQRLIVCSCLSLGKSFFNFNAPCTHKQKSAVLLSSIALVPLIMQDNYASLPRYWWAPRHADPYGTVAVSVGLEKYIVEAATHPSPGRAAPWRRRLCRSPRAPPCPPSPPVDRWGCTMKPREADGLKEEPASSRTAPGLHTPRRGTNRRATRAVIQAVWKQKHWLCFPTPNTHQK